MNRGILGGDLSATFRHMSRLLRLLPSRPDRVHKVSLRKDQKATIENAQSCEQPIEAARIMTKANRICKRQNQFLANWLFANLDHYSLQFDLH
jgi:hypothetical protein